MALSLYNKYRPQTFKDVVGQEHVEKTLANAVEKGKVSHAYLFCGPRGTGKTTTARILAKALLCEKAPTATPDGTCEQCMEISQGVHPDVYELDAASRTGVDNVREEIIGRVNFAPTHGSHKIYIIDEVHMLSTPAFNALLKTLEEPPSHVIFVLCTTDVHKVPDTVQARCQRFDFKRLTLEEIVGRLRYICEREGFETELSALDLIARRSQGGMRDAIRSLEQAAVFSGGRIQYGAAESLLGMVDADQLFLLGDSLAEGDAAACFDWVAGYVQSGSDIAILVNDFATHVRNLYAVCVSRGSDEHLVSALELDAEALPRLREQAARFKTQQHLAWMLTVLGSLSAELKNAANARLALEVALTRMLYPESTMSLDALAVRVAKLEDRINRGEGHSEHDGQRVVGREERRGTSAPTANNVESEAKSSSLPMRAGTAEQAATASVAQTNQTAQVAQEGSSARTAQGDSSARVVREDSSTRATQDDISAQTVQPEHTAQDAQADNPIKPVDEQSGEGQDNAGSDLPEPQLEKTDEQALYRAWNNTVDSIKKQRLGVAANLGGVTPRLSKDGSRLNLELPAGSSTSLQYLEGEANRSLLIQAVEKAFGKPLQVTLSLAFEELNREESRESPVATTPGAEAGAKRAEDVSGDGLGRENLKDPASGEFGREGSENTGISEPNGESSEKTASEPSKEELEAILRNSLNSEIKFE